MKRASNFFLLAVLVFVSSCSVLVAELDFLDEDFVDDPLADDQGFIVIYKPEIAVGAAIKMPILIDGQFIGEIGRRSYIKIPLESGEHTVSTYYQTGTHSQVVNVMSGDTTYYRYEGTFEHKSKEDAENLVNRLNRIATGSQANFKYYKKTKEVNPGKSVLYIYRPRINIAHMLESYTPRMVINGREVGRFSAGHFLELELNPGQHNAAFSNKKLALNINLEEGKIHYLRIHSAYSGVNSTQWELHFLETNEPLPEILSTISVK